MDNSPVVLITGAAKRIGAATAKQFHRHGYRVIVSYHQSAQAADNLVRDLNQQKPQSAAALAMNLLDISSIMHSAEQAIACFGQIDMLINNASHFQSGTLDQLSERQWDETINCNVKAALFLSQALAKSLQQQQGCIINLVDIYAEKPLKHHIAYNVSKAGIAMLTRSLALDLAPHIRVNGISPGAILWPENSTAEWEQSLLERIPLAKLGNVNDIAKTALFLAQSPYITGQIIAVDGGRSLNM